jgi:hypothetical protein
MEDQLPTSAPSDSDQAALDAMVERTYEKIKRIAARMPGVKSGTSVSPTVVANETYLKFLHSKNSRELAHREVIGIFVRLMKQVLVDLARRRSTKRNDVRRRRRRARVFHCSICVCGDCIQDHAPRPAHPSAHVQRYRLCQRRDASGGIGRGTRWISLWLRQ